MTHKGELISAFRLAAKPPQAWIEAAALIPSTLGDLGALNRLIEDPAFRARFTENPEAATRGAGLPATEPVLAALHEQID